MGNEVSDPNVVSDSEEVLFVLASSGLNLRKTIDPASEVLVNMPYGAAVSIVSSSSSDAPSLTVENMEGQMIEVSYQDGQANLTGFAFSGFLSPIPPPEGSPENKYQYVRDYVASLQQKGFEATLNEPKTENSRLAIELPLSDHNAGFLIMKRLFSIPNGYTLPELGKSINYSTPESPSKATQNGPYDYVTQTLTYKGYADEGTLEIVYYDDNEVGGRDLTLQLLVGDDVSVWINLRNWSH